MKGLILIRNFGFLHSKPLTRAASKKAAGLLGFLSLLSLASLLWTNRQAVSTMDLRRLQVLKQPPQTDRLISLHTWHLLGQPLTILWSGVIRTALHYFTQLTPFVFSLFPEPWSSCPFPNLFQPPSPRSWPPSTITQPRLRLLGVLVPQQSNSLPL